MSQENVEIVLREYDAFAARDWIALADIWHPEIEYEVLMGAGTFRGLDQVTRFFDAYRNPYTAFRVDAEEILDAGEHVVAVERLEGHGLMGTDTGAPVHETFARVISFKDGRIWRAKEYATREEALEAVGQSE